MWNRAVLLLPLVVACGPAMPPLQNPAPATQTATAAQAWQTGSYRATITAGDLPAGAPAVELAGAWEIQFHGGNHFVVRRDGAQVLEGPYQISGNRLTFAAGESGPYACNTVATYTWQMSGG